MENFTKEELLLIHRIVRAADKNKTASRPYNILAEAGYDKIPKELEQVVKKLAKAVSD